jgi:hypothetical protein
MGRAAENRLIIRAYGVWPAVNNRNPQEYVCCRSDVWVFDFSYMLLDPPYGYLSPPTDLSGGLERIYQKAAADHFTSQYEFDNAFTQLVSSANDGHFYVQLCSTSIFVFEIRLPLVSISSDGLQLPQIYTRCSPPLIDAWLTGHQAD